MTTNNQPFKNIPPTKKDQNASLQKIWWGLVGFFFVKVFDCLLFETIASAFIKIRFLKLFSSGRCHANLCDQNILAKDRKDQHCLQQAAITLQVFFYKKWNMPWTEDFEDFTNKPSVNMTELLTCVKLVMYICICRIRAYRTRTQGELEDNYPKRPTINICGPNSTICTVYWFGSKGITWVIVSILYIIQIQQMGNWHAM